MRTEEIVSPGVVATGAPLTVWVDTAGRVVAAPLTPTDVRDQCDQRGLDGLGHDHRRRRSGGRRRPAATGPAPGLGMGPRAALLAHNDDGWANRRA